LGQILITYNSIYNLEILNILLLPIDIIIVFFKIITMTVSLTPYITNNLPGSHQDKLLELVTLDAALNANIPKPIRAQTEQLLRLVNSFYSNKIEGNPTLPNEILKTQYGEKDTTKKSKGINEILSHLEIQLKLTGSILFDKDDVYDPTFMKLLHEQFFKYLPKEYLIVKDKNNKPVKDKAGKIISITPGAFRKHNVKVGDHIPPEPSQIDAYIKWYTSSYDFNKIFGTNKILAAICSHHRFSWIHPFMDGNGRVGRLLTDCQLKLAGLGGSGLWTISRGLGRDTDSYYRALSLADKSRQGDTDGRGILSDKGLISFIEYFLDTALDQVKYFSDLLDPHNLRTRIDIYFEYRARGSFTDHNGDKLAPLRIESKDIYRTLLERGDMSRAELYKILGKGESTIRPILNKMAKEHLINAPKRKDISLNLSPSSIAVIFPQLW